jgi:hypothetical protein
MYSSFKSVRWYDSSAERWLPGKVESRQDVLAHRCTHSGQRIVGSAYYTLCHKEVHRQHTLSPRVARVRCCPREQMICSSHLSPDASVHNTLAHLASANRVALLDMPDAGADVQAVHKAEERGGDKHHLSNTSLGHRRVTGIACRPQVQV